jgi:hypothetical protein
MRLSRTSLQKAVAGVAMGTGLVATGAANAGIVFDLRFSDNSKTQVATPNASYTLDLWARVSGTNGNATDDGLQGALTSLISRQISGGAILSGGMVSSTMNPDFTSFSGTTPLARAGTGSDLNGDGAIDWGSTSTSGSNSNYQFTRAGGIVTGGGAIGQAVDANTWEFRLASFTVTLGATLGAGQTAFDVVKPTASQTPSAFTYIVGRVDNTTFNVTSSIQQGTYTGSSGVLFIVPEPASLGLLGTAAIGLLGRRRRTK